MTDYDPEYVIDLWDYTRKYESVEQCVQIMAGNSIQTYGDGIEALESYHFPEVGAAPRVSARHLAEMPPKLAEKVWERERSVLNDVISMTDPDKQQIFTLINWLEVGDEVLGIDVEHRIIDAIHVLPECESKVDMLEKHCEISGEEWYDRASELAG
jgi:hypothetical protein